MNFASLATDQCALFLQKDNQPRSRLQPVSRRRARPRAQQMADIRARMDTATPRRGRETA